MKLKLLALLTFASLLSASELKITSQKFTADENTGISIFTGKVNILKNRDELNASEVTVYTDKNNSPIKFVAVGKVSFMITTENGAQYKGKAQKAIYYPKIKEYHFFEDVHLKQIDDKKDIIGDEVVLKTIEGKAYAKGLDTQPVIMIFDISDANESNESNDSNTSK